MERRLADLGRELFSCVFASPSGQRLWARVQADLADLRIEVAAEVADATALPWELLRDPVSDEWLALSARSFVRVNHSPAQPTRMPPDATAGAALRVLLVICRPGGDDDVPFRSVASQLVRSGAGMASGAGAVGPDPRQALDVSVLRPPTFGRLTAVLTEAARRDFASYGDRARDGVQRVDALVELLTTSG